MNKPVMTQINKTPSINITFTNPNNGEYLGEFYEEGGQLKFTGNVNESAKVFVEFVCKSFNERIKQERQEMIYALREVQESHVMSDGLTLVSDQTKDKIKTALRNAGAITEDL